MTTSSVFRRSAAATAMVAAAFGLASNTNEVQAADQCLPAQQMIEHLNGKGQRSLVALEHLGSNKQNFVLRAYYSTMDGSRGTEVYGVTARRPGLKTGQLQMPEELCIEEEFTNITLVLNEKKEIPASFYEQHVSTEEALKICVQRGWGDDCTSHNLGYLLDQSASNRYPMLRMTVADFNSRGDVVRLGLNKTVIADVNPHGEMRGVVEDSVDGVGKTAYHIAGATYTKDGLTALAEGWPVSRKYAEAGQPPVQVAAAAPR